MTNYAAVWMSGTVLSFCLMAVAIKEISVDIATLQIIFLRSCFGLFIAAAILYFSKRKIVLKNISWRAHLLRNIFHFAGHYGWVLGVGILLLAEVFALEFIAPFGRRLSPVSFWRSV